MTRFFLDDRDVTGQVWPSGNLKEVLEKLEQAGAHLCIKEVRLDGEPLVLNVFRPEALDSRQLQVLSEVRIIQAKPTEIAARAVDGFQDFLKQLPPRLLELAAGLRSGNQQQAFKDLGRLLESYNELNNLLGLLLEMKLLPEDWREPGDKPAAPRFQELIQELIRCQEERDFMLMADLVEYELPARNSEFLELMEKAQKALAGQQADSV